MAGREAGGVAAGEARKATEGEGGDDRYVSDFLERRIERLRRDRQDVDVDWLRNEFMLRGVPPAWVDLAKRVHTSLLTKFLNTRGDRLVCNEHGDESEYAIRTDAQMHVRDLPISIRDLDALMAKIHGQAQRRGGAGYEHLAKALQETLGMPLKPYRRRDEGDLVLVEPATYIGWREWKEGYETKRVPLALFRLKVALRFGVGRSKSRSDRLPRLVLTIERVVGVEDSGAFQDLLKRCALNLVVAVAENALGCVDDKFERGKDDGWLDPNEAVPLGVTLEVLDEARELRMDLHASLRRHMEVPEAITRESLHGVWHLRHLDIVSLESVVMTNAHAQGVEQARQDALAAKAALNVKRAAGEEFMLLAFFVDSLRRQEDGSYCRGTVAEQRIAFIEEWSKTPEELLSDMGVRKEWFAERHTWEAIERKVIDAIEASDWTEDDGESDFEIAKIAQHAAHLCGGGAAVYGSDLVLRLLIDTATGATFARLAPREGPQELLSASFLRLATDGLEPDSFGFRPSFLKVPKNLLATVDGVRQWCDEHDVQLMHPRSGFDAGAHHVKAWKEELGDGMDFWDWDNKKVSATLSELMERTVSLSRYTAGDSGAAAGRGFHLRVGRRIDFLAWRSVSEERRRKIIGR